MFDAIAKPFGVLLMLLFDLCNSYGLAVILFAVAVKIILLPFQMKAKRGMLAQQRLAPRQQELQKKHGGNNQKYQQELMEMYKEEGVSMTGGCLWSFLPLPILMALWQAIRYPLTIMMGVPKDMLAEGGAIVVKLTELGFVEPAKAAYLQIAQTQFIAQHIDAFREISDKIRAIDYTFLGVDLGATPNFKIWEFRSGSEWLMFLIPLISAGLALLFAQISQKMNPVKPNPDDPNAATSKMMTYMSPVMSLFFGFSMPTTMSVYWAVGTVLDILRDVWLTKRYTKVMEAEDVVRNAQRKEKDAELERKRAETERLKAENKTVANPNTSKKKQDAAERAEREARAAEYERLHNPPKDEPVDPSREGARRHARGRAYDPERYGDAEFAEADEDDAEPQD